MRIGLGLALLWLMAVPPPLAAQSGPSEATAPPMLRADRAWSARSDRLEGRLARPEATERALAAYLEAIGADERAQPAAPGLAARWKALRAAHFLSEFTTASEERRDEAIERATKLAEASVESIARLAGGRSPRRLEGEALDAWVRDSSLDRSEVALVHFWSAIVWGARGQRVGLLTIVRQGIARRIYEDAVLATRLDPRIERGGAFRLLSRLNADLPRVPFVSGWVDRDEALPQAERAFEIDPEDPGNHVILALALREFAPARGAEAREIMARAAAATPRPELRAEDLAILEEAGDTLADWTAAEG